MIGKPIHNILHCIHEMKVILLINFYCIIFIRSPPTTGDFMSTTLRKSEDESYGCWLNAFLKLAVIFDGHVITTHALEE